MVVVYVVLAVAVVAAIYFLFLRPSGSNRTEELAPPARELAEDKTSVPQLRDAEPKTEPSTPAAPPPESTAEHDEPATDSPGTSSDVRNSRRLTAMPSVA